MRAMGRMCEGEERRERVEGRELGEQKARKGEGERRWPADEERDRGSREARGSTRGAQVMPPCDAGHAAIGAEEDAKIQGLTGEVREGRGGV